MGNFNHIFQNFKDISAEIEHVRSERAGDEPVQLGVVSKYSSIEETEAAILAGATILCENRVQDAEVKIPALASYDVQWHLIGNLQRNKVRKAVSLFSCIQSVDSESLLQKIDEVAGEVGKKMPVLLQINVSDGDGRNGFDLMGFSDKVPKYRDIFLNVKIQGIMTIIPYEEDVERQLGYFSKAREVFLQLQERLPAISTLSMGMSQDFRPAILSGATLVRIGSSIFKGGN